ncbi:MAG: MATE family efflux transporter [Gammaproteobacteria bacterium]
MTLPTGVQLRADLATICRIGWPLIVNNVASIAVNVADTLMASSLGTVQLAAVAIGSGLWIALLLLGLGTVMALGPTVAQHFGAGRDQDIGHDTRQGLWLAAGVAALVIVLMRAVEPFLLAIGIEAEVARLSQGYLAALSWGVPAAYAYHALKQMSEGVGRTLPIMTVMAIALPINVTLNYSFMFGDFGAPALGAVGCGLGNGIAFWVMFTMLAVYVGCSRHYARFELWRGFEWPDAGAIGRLVRLGTPIGLSLFLQSGLFTTVALMMGALGTAAVAAHQVVLNYSGLVFMAPLGLGMALTVCVGQAVGRRDIAGAARIGYTGVALCGSLALVSALTSLYFAEAITRVYTEDPAIVGLAVVLFRVAAALQLGDGVQVAAAFALRGLKDTRVPLAINALNYWGIGFTVAWVCGVALDFGAVGIWAGLATALITAGGMLIWRFRVVTRRLARAEAGRQARKTLAAAS